MTLTDPGAGLVLSAEEEMDALTRRIIHSDLMRSRNEERLMAELERLYVMQRVGTSIYATFNLEQLLRVVATSLVRDLGFERVLIFLPVDGDDGLICRTWQGYESREKDSLSPLFAELLVRQARLSEYESGGDQPRSITLDDEHCTPEEGEALSRAGLAAAILAPVFSRQELVGGIMAGRAGAFPPITRDDLDYFSLICSQTGIAIVNSRLYRRIEDYSRNLEREVSERTRELFSAYRELQESKDILVQSEKMAFLGQLTAGIAHEINTPIGAVQNSLKSMEDLLEELKASVEAPEVTAEDYREILGEMSQSLAVASSAIAKAAKFVRSVKAQTRDLANMEVRSFDPIGTLGDIIVLLQHELRKSNATVDVEADPKEDLGLFGDPGKFSQIMTNLVNNAIDAYENKGGQVLVRVYRKGNDVVFDIVDHGCGISEDNKKRLFKQMFTTKWQGKGTGLGLSIVYGLVTGAFGGLIDVESELEQGTTFTVRLPRRKPEEVAAAAKQAAEEARQRVQEAAQGAPRTGLDEEVEPPPGEDDE